MSPVLEGLAGSGTSNLSTKITVSNPLQPVIGRQNKVVVEIAHVGPQGPTGATGPQGVVSLTDNNEWTGNQDFAGGRPWYALEALATSGLGTSGSPWAGWETAFNALAAGSIVRAGPGHFNIGATTPLLVDDMSLEGSGWGTVFHVTGAAHDAASLDGFRNDDPTNGNSRIRLANFRVIGPEDGTMTTSNGPDFGKGIWLRKVTDFEIENVRVSRMNIQGIRVDQCTRGKVRGCTIAEIYSGNGISVEDNSVDVVVEGNTVHTIADCGIATHNGSIRTIISDNAITNTNFGRGVDVFGAPETVVIGNTIRDVGGSGSAGRGIQLAVGLSLTVPDKCVIANNVIVSPAQDGILVSASITITDVSIVGNIVRGAGDKGIYLSGVLRRINVSGNSLLSGATQGIYVEHSGASIPQQIVITGNLCRGNGSWGILATSAVVECLIAMNQTRGNTAGQVSAPVACTVLYEFTDGYLQLDKGLTAQEIYATATFSLSDGANLLTGTTTGSQIGTTASQKLGFFGATPIVQPAANPDTSGASLATLETEVNQIKAALRSLGLIAT